MLRTERDEKRERGFEFFFFFGFEESQQRQRCLPVPSLYFPFFSSFPKSPPSFVKMKTKEYKKRALRFF